LPAVTATRAGGDEDVGQADAVVGERGGAVAVVERGAGGRRAGDDLELGVVGAEPRSDESRTRRTIWSTRGLVASGVERDGVGDGGVVDDEE
jgi:hypothetical protein